MRVDGVDKYSERIVQIDTIQYEQTNEIRNPQLHLHLHLHSHSTSWSQVCRPLTCFGGVSGRMEGQRGRGVDLSISLIVQSALHFHNDYERAGQVEQDGSAI